MKVTLVNYSDVGGGAARAAYRLHRVLLDYGVDSRMRVANKGTDDYRVEAPLGKARKALSLLRAYAGGLPMCLQTSMNPIQHSLAVLPSNLAAEFQRSEAEIVHLHWVCGDLISIADIGRIRKPVLWTLHDSWAFCGTEHHPDGLDDERFVTGYAPESQRSGHRGLDLD
ncbi:MAG: glycosyl transferase, partial [Nitrososphaerales archaeon]